VLYGFVIWNCLKINDVIELFPILGAPVTKTVNGAALVELPLAKVHTSKANDLNCINPDVKAGLTFIFTLGLNVSPS
jgi:hypothetical protein